MIWKQEEGTEVAAGRLRKAVAETVTPKFMAAAEGGSSGLTPLPRFTEALVIQRHEASRRIFPVSVNAWERTSWCRAAGSPASRG